MIVLSRLKLLLAIRRLETVWNFVAIIMKLWYLYQSWGKNEKIIAFVSSIQRSGKKPGPREPPV
jgi:hypothetical protein